MVEERRKNCNESCDIDPVQFGKLIGSVEALTKAVNDLTSDVIILKEKLNTGRGVAIGLLIASAGIGGTVGAFAHKLLEVVK
jgi:hypothetical protein